MKVVHIVLLTLIVLFSTKMIESANVNLSTKMLPVVVLAIGLTGIYLDYNTAILLLTLFIVNVKGTVEKYDTLVNSITVSDTELVFEEDAALEETKFPTSASPQEDTIAELPLEEVPQEGPKVDADDVVSYHHGHSADDSTKIAIKEEVCVPEFVISKNMLHNAQNNIFDEQNMNMFPNETRDKNINIQGFFEEVTGYSSSI